MKGRVLFCSYVPPMVDQDSGSRRIWNLIDILHAEGWRVYFLASMGLGGNPQYARLLQQRGIAVHDGSNGSVAKLLSAVRFDLAIFAFWPTAELYLPFIRRLSPGTRVIVDSLDLHFLRDARRIFRDEIAGSGSLLDADFASQMRGEINTYAAADAVLTVSLKESSYINDLTGEPLLAHPVADSEALEISRVGFATRDGIVMIGCYQHPPNVQAAAWLCREILPLLPEPLRSKVPVYIVGSALDDTVRNYGRGLSNVRMVGWVPSILPYLERARVSVVPLRYGAGTKRKMIQALMAGTPTVSTSIGAEGFQLRDGEHVLIADEPSRFAAAIARLYEDHQLWRRLQLAGHAQVTEHHSAAVARSQFLEVVYWYA